MYDTFFNLARRPFAATPDPNCCAGVPTMQNAYNELYDCLETREGIGILTSAAGLGKTLLCRKLVADLSATFAVVYLANSNFSSRRNLLQSLLYELGHSYARKGDQELRLELTSAIHQVTQQRRAIVLVIDEAHLLSNELLEEIRCLTNLAAGSVQLVRVLLSGQLLLEERLIAGELDALNQRIRAHCSLETLTQQESVDYLAFRLHWAGADLHEILHPDAVQLIAQAADGIPRCLNHLCDHSLMLGASAGQKPVSVTTVEDALDDAKQLPLHWNQLITTRRIAAIDDTERIVASRHVEPSGQTDEPVGADARTSSAAGRTASPERSRQLQQASLVPDCQLDEAAETSVFEIGSQDESSVSSFAAPAAKQSTRASCDEIAAGCGSADILPSRRSSGGSIVVSVASDIVAPEPVQRPKSAADLLVEENVEAEYEEHVSEHVVRAVVDRDSSVDEEVIIDAYAALDARQAERQQLAVGQHASAPKAGPSAPASNVRLRHRDVPDVPERQRKGVRQPRPDLTIDDVVPLLETILDAGSDKKSPGEQTAMPRHAHRRHLAQPAGSDEPVEGYDVILPPDDSDTASAGGSTIRPPGIFDDSPGLNQGAGNSRIQPDDARQHMREPTRPYERLFSDLRRRQQRA